MRVFVIALLFFSLCLTGVQALAENDAPANTSAPAATTSPERWLLPLGIAARASTLGFGADIATPVTRHSNARVGFNLFNYSRTLSKDQVSYAGTLRLQSVQTIYDFFPFAANFHLSPGLLVYNGNKISADASVPITKSFSLGGYQYTAAGNIAGSANMSMNKVAPMFLVGWGNLVPRSHRHLTFSVEGGFVYQGSPDVKLALTSGTVCINGTATCKNPLNVATDSTVQANIASEQTKLNNSISAFQFYPVISFGFGYKF